MSELECTCLPYSAGGDGPERDCPVHGEPIDEPDPRDEHDEWHPHWVEGCDGCIDRADYLEQQRVTRVDRVGTDAQ